MTFEVEKAPQTPRTDRCGVLLRVSQSLIASRCSEELFNILASELREVVNFYFLGVSIYDEKAHEVCIRTFGEPGASIQPPKLATEETFTWWVYQHQQPLVIPNVDEETRFPEATRFLKDLRIRSICTLPLTTVHRRLGGLSVGSQEPDAYSREEVSFLSLVANQVALAVDDALNFEASRVAQEELESQRRELQRERDQLQLLLEVTNSTVSNLELRDLLRAVSATIRQGMHCDAVAVFLPDAESGQLRLHALDFPETKGVSKEDSVYPVEGSVLGRVFKAGKLFVGTKAELMSERDAPETQAEGIGSACALPLISRNRTLGVLALGRRDENSFSPEDVDFLVRGAGQVAIAIENALAYREITDLKDKLAQEKLYLEDEIRTELNFEQIVGESAALRRTLEHVEKVAPTDSTVLIYGETGTGKELIARAIHDGSARHSSAFVKLNCAAIPTGLLESELFGHEKGAFTGAVAQRIGRFELARRGTIFLDEISEIPLELQPKLLRVLQEREFERLGSSHTIRTDARLIAATNRDLTAMVADQRFRSDLFYRLNVFPVYVPPLRERSEDIPLLVRRFAQQFSRRMNKRIETIPSETLHKLSRYHWPGNIRELQNVIERAVILSNGPVLKVDLSHLKPLAAAGNGAVDSKDTLEEAERKHIASMLENTHWVVAGPNGAAARLGMNRSTLQYRMRKLGLSRPSPRSTASP